MAYTLLIYLYLTNLGVLNEKRCKGGVQGDSAYGATLLDATQWHLGTLVPLKGGVQGERSSPYQSNRIAKLFALYLLSFQSPLILRDLVK